MQSNHIQYTHLNEVQLFSYSQATMEATIAESPPIPATEGTGIIMLLGQSAFPAGMRAAMARAINAKVSGLNVNQSPSCLNVEVFFTRLIWDKTSDKQYNGCLVEIAHLFERAGLVYATEHTYVSAFSALALARRNPDQSNGLLHDIERARGTGPGKYQTGQAPSLWPNLNVPDWSIRAEGAASKCR